MAEESWGGQNRRSYESAVAGHCEHAFGTAVITFAGAASGLVSLLFRPGVPSCPANDIDGLGQISGS